MNTRARLSAAVSIVAAVALSVAVVKAAPPEAAVGASKDARVHEADKTLNADDKLTQHEAQQLMSELNEAQAIQAKAAQKQKDATSKETAEAITGGGSSRRRPAQSVNDASRTPVAVSSGVAPPSQPASLPAEPPPRKTRPARQPAATNDAEHPPQQEPGPENPEPQTPNP